MTLTKVCSQLGMVSGLTKVLLAKDNGNTIRNITPCTAPDVRTVIPTNTEIQQKHSAKAMEMPIAGGGRHRVGLDPEAHQHAEPEGDDTQDQVPADVRDHRADQRDRSTDRQRPEPVEDALLDVGVEVLAQRHPGHRDRLAEQAGQQELQVVLRGPADRAAEDVGEQHQEDDRLQGDVDQRLRRAPGLDQAALGQREDVPVVAAREDVLAAAAGAGLRCRAGAAAAAVAVGA